MSDTDGIPIGAYYRAQRRFQRFQFHIGTSCGRPVIGKETLLGFGMRARVDGGDPGDEHDGE